MFHKNDQVIKLWGAFVLLLLLAGRVGGSEVSTGTGATAADKAKLESMDHMEQHSPRTTNDWHGDLLDMTDMHLPLYSPLSLLGDLDHMRHMWKRTRDRGLGSDWMKSDSPMGPAMQVMKAKDGGFQVTVDLPGVDPKEVHVELTEDEHGRDILRVHGERKEEVSKKDNKKGYYSERRFHGHFERSLALPADANKEAISSSFKNGVLTLHVPRVKEALRKPRAIPIKME